MVAPARLNDPDDGSPRGLQMRRIIWRSKDKRLFSVFGSIKLVAEVLVETSFNQNKVNFSYGRQIKMILSYLKCTLSESLNTFSCFYFLADIVVLTRCSHCTAKSKMSKLHRSNRNLFFFSFFFSFFRLINRTSLVMIKKESFIPCFV